MHTLTDSPARMTRSFVENRVDFFVLRPLSLFARDVQIGKEVVVRYSTGLASAKKWLTDSNGRERALSHNRCPPAVTT